MRGHVPVRKLVRAHVAGRISGLRGAVPVAYDVNVARPLVNIVQSAAQQAQPVRAAVLVRYEQATPLQAVVAAVWQSAAQRSALVQVRFERAQQLQALVAQHCQQARPVAAPPVAQRFEQARPLRQAVQQQYQQAARVGVVALQCYEEARRLRNVAAQQYQQALRVGAVVLGGFRSAAQLGRPVAGRYEEARKPPPGVTPGPVRPQPDPCYVPSVPAHLVFDELHDPSQPVGLVFVCERHTDPEPEPGVVVVPIRKVYVTVNSITLRRVVGNVPLQAESFGMSIDVDSWTWNWSASMPASAREHLAPVDGLPVVLEATVNGVPYRLCAESMSRSRTHGSSRISVQGRGLGAVLDAPYAPTLAFGNATSKTAQQLAGDVLTINGVGMGWAVDWGLTDWVVPGGLWTHQGSYISAINAIAAAAGGYVQPHATAQTLRILRRYPAMPWAWGSVTPDYELPADVVEVEGVEWVSKPAYNWVHVAGIAGGVQVEAKRAGTAGDLDAPGVADALITHVDAARQRAAAVLADTGPQATVSLKLPVLASTGLIQPGKFVRYLDGAVTRVGIVRGTALDWQRPQFSDLVAKPQRQVAAVLSVSVSGDVARVQLPGGGELQALGGATPGQKVFVRDGVIEGEAPNLPLYQIEID
eukprot:gene16412-16228_t